MISVAMDGPAGAGKSTLAKAAAKELGYIYVDTGALYRTLGYKALQNGFTIEAGEPIEKMLGETTVDIRFVDGTQHVFLDGVDVNDKIRTPEVSMAASKISAIPAVRAFLLEKQREMARNHDILMDGRDIGTVVLPNATVKVFITASAEERANRRYKELIEKGQQVEYRDVYDDIVKRDYADSHREIAPLKPADDAIMFDTTSLPLEPATRELIKLIREKVDGQ